MSRRAQPRRQKKPAAPKGSVSVRVVAAAAGVSKSTAGYVLRNANGPSSETRTRVLKIARRLGYVPDARVTSVMAKVRGAASKQLVSIAWINTHNERDSWHRYKFMLPYWEGAQARCSELGYRLEEIWTLEPGMTNKRLSQILYHRGIEGVIVTPHASHIRLNWEKLAGVCLGTELVAPRLHRVTTDFILNLQLALKMTRRAGYRRIGVCLSKALDQSTYHVPSALVHHWSMSAPEDSAVPFMFYTDGRNAAGKSPEGAILSWIKEHRPDAIICHHSHLVEWLEKWGYRVPSDIGVVHLAVDDDVLEWTGIYSNRREIGRATAELVVSLIQNRQFGVPETARDTKIQGVWSQGRTLLAHKLK